MIKLENLTPDVYYRQSRDFQFIGRLFDVVLNSVKTNADTIYSLPLSEDSAEQYAELMATTFGFTPKHRYTAHQLKLLCTAFATVMKHKGNIQSFAAAANTLIRADGCDQPLTYTLSDNNTVLNLIVPPDVQNTNLLYELFDYTLPAGMSCSITRQIIDEQKANTVLTTSDKITKYGDTQGKTSNQNLNYIPQVTLKDDLTKVNPALKDALAKDTAGINANSVLYIKPETN